jgi:methanethiol S-methyltransferase
MKYIFLFCYLSVWEFIHSLLASYAVKNKINTFLGRDSHLYYRISYNIISFLSLIPVVFIVASAPEKVLYIIPFPWFLLNLLVEGILSFLLIAGIIQTGISEFIGVKQLMETKNSTSINLVTNGMYKYVRHPLYLIGLLIIWLSPVMSASLLVINISLTIYIFIGAYLEEKKLVSDFGQKYVEYIRTTPQFIPFTKRTKLFINRHNQ